MQLTAILALAATALVYPLCLDQNLFLGLEAWFAKVGPGWEKFFQSNIRPPLQFGYHPLVLKETLGAVTTVLMALAYIPWKLLYSPVRREKRVLHAPLLLFLVLAVLSLHWTAAFHGSLQTLEALIPAAVFFLMVSDIDWGPRDRRRLLTALTAIGAILCAVALCQLTPGLSRGYYRLFYKFDDPRNTLGAWIGHNTELSSYVLSAFLGAMALFFTTRGFARRIGLGIFLIAAAFVIIAGQSRAIWPLALALGGGAAWLMARETGRRPRIVHVLVAGLVVLALCAPLAPQLRQRIQRYSPQALIAETRLRILAASIPLIREKPLLGHGIGSFVAIYPKAQADYFAFHPASRLVQTDKRTEQAHDDYLQLWIELGALGVGLWLAGFFLYAREGARGWKALSSPNDRVPALAFGCIALQHSLNAFVNFPAHVASSVYLFILAVGVWVALGREANPPTIVRPRPAPRRAVARIGLLVACLLPITAAPLLWIQFAREAVVSAHDQMGVGLLMAIDPRSGASDRERILAVDRAERHFLHALQLDPLDSETLFHLAGVYLESGTNFLKAYAFAQAHGAPDDQKSLLRLLAEQNLRRCLNRLDMCFAEMRFHQSLFLAGQAYHALARLDPGKSYQSKAIEYYEAAVRYSAVYYDALRELASELATLYAQPGQKPDPERLIKLGRQMLHSDPERYRKDFVVPALNRIWLLEFQPAAQALQNAIDVDPDNANLRFTQILSLVEAGQMERAAQAVVDLEMRLGRPPEYWQSLALIRMAAGQYDAALAIAMEHGAAAQPPNPWLAAIASLLLERKGESGQARRVWAEADLKSAGWVPMQSLRAYWAYAHLHSAELALEAIKPLAGLDKPPALALYVRAWIAYDRGDRPAAARDAKQAFEAGLVSEPVRRLRQLAGEGHGAGPNGGGSSASRPGAPASSAASQPGAK